MAVRGRLVIDLAEPIPRLPLPPPVIGLALPCCWRPVRLAAADAATCDLADGRPVPKRPVALAPRPRRLVPALDFGRAVDRAERAPRDELRAESRVKSARSTTPHIASEAATVRKNTACIAFQHEGVGGRTCLRLGHLCKNRLNGNLLLRYGGMHAREFPLQLLPPVSASATQWK